MTPWNASMKHCCGAMRLGESFRDFWLEKNRWVLYGYILWCYMAVYFGKNDIFGYDAIQRYIWLNNQGGVLNLENWHKQGLWVDHTKKKVQREKLGIDVKKHLGLKPDMGCDYLSIYLSIYLYISIYHHAYIRSFHTHLGFNDLTS